MRQEIIMDMMDNMGKLKQFMDKNNMLEIALRGKNKKFVAFQKIAFCNAPQGETRDAVQKVLEAINENKKEAKKILDSAKNLAKVPQISLLLNGVNLCATCAGFAVMYVKLDKLSSQINQVMNKVKQGTEIQVDFEFNKVIAEHRNMLDCRKTQKYYSEDQMRKLVDDEYNVLKLLIDEFLKDLSTEPEGLIFSMFSLAAMLAVSIRYFDELYYFNNKEAIGDGDKWHTSHDSWVSVYDSLAGEEVMKKIQDYGLLDLNLSTAEGDMYYISLYDQALSMKEDIKDNQVLIETIDDKESFAEFSKCVNEDVEQTIKMEIEQITGTETNEEVQKILQDAMKQVTLAV